MRIQLMGEIPIAKLIITKGKKGMMSIRMIGGIELMMFYSHEMGMSLQVI